MGSRANADAFFDSGKAESITITNEKGRLSQEEIDRMIQEAEEFAAEDEQQRKRIESLNSLSNFVFGLKNQLGDQEGLGGKLDESDKKKLQEILKETTEWLDSEGAAAQADELDEKLAEVQAAVAPITSKIYAGAGGESAGGAADEEYGHDEL